MSVTSIASAADWYVAPNGISSATGSIGQPWSLDSALTNYGVIQAGDTIWLRGGTYVATNTNCPTSNYGVDTNGNITTTPEPCFEIGLNGSKYSNSNNVIVIRSYSHELARLDGLWRDSWQPTDANNNIQWGYIRFQDVDICDSMKGMHATNFLTYPSGPWQEFAFKFTKEVDFVNCTVHDIDNGFCSNIRTIRGCIIWNVGVNGYEHVCYPSPFNDFSGNIVGWTVNDVIEHSPNSFIMQSNIIFGSGQTSWQTEGIDTLVGSTNVWFHHNYTYNFFPSMPPAGYPQGCRVGSQSGIGIITNNVFVCPGTPITFGNNNCTNLIFERNLCFMDEIATNGRESYSSAIVAPFINTNTMLIDFNQYYVTPPYVDFTFAESTMTNDEIYNYYNWSQWRAAYPAVDAHSSTNYGPPTNMTFVIPNQDASRRCNIAVYNFASNNIVNVNLNGVLNPGDSYQLYNAQDYGRGVITSGIYNGNSLSIPMTNLTTSAILYGTNWGLFQPAPMSPAFGAFVIIGKLAPPQNLRATNSF